MRTHRQQKLAARVAGCGLLSSIVLVETGVHSSSELSNSTALCSMQKSISKCSIASPDFGVSGGEAFSACDVPHWGSLGHFCLFVWILIFFIFVSSHVTSYCLVVFIHLTVESNPRATAISLGSRAAQG
jgi:hypothetical protein